MALEREPLEAATPSTDATDWDDDVEGPRQRQIAPHWHLEGSVRARDSDFCFEDQAVHAWTAEPPRLLPWLIQLEAALQQARGPLPSYWERLSPQVRRSSLSPSLARLAYMRAQAGHASSRRVFWWLVDEEARRMRPDVRLQWVLYLWQSGTDADLQEIQRRLGVADIELDERVHRASQLMWSKLPWPVVERRLMAPGLMQRAGESLGPWLGQRDSRLNMTAAISKRREWSGWSRLLRSAGTARACFVADAVWMFQPNAHSDPKPALARLADWATGPAGYFFRESGPEHCDPTARLLAMGAGCNDPADTHPAVAVAWLKAGLVLHPESVARALSPAGVWGKGECQLEPAPTGPFPYRVRKR